MKRNDRISINFSDLPIESTLKVTKFINEFLINDWLDPDVFDKKIKKYSMLEQYFICEYGKEYYSKLRLKQWLRLPENSERFEEKMINILLQNADNFILSIEGMKSSLWRILAQQKRTLQSLKKLHIPFEEGVIEFRLPLYFPPLLTNDSKIHNKSYTVDIDSFGEYFQNLFKDIFSDEDIHYLLYNSFIFQNNLYPVRLLYIEVEKITTFKDKMHQLYTAYSKLYETNKKRYENYYTQYLKDLLNGKITKKVTDTHGIIIDTKELIVLSDAQKGYYSKLKKSIKLPEVNKYDFAKVLYNSFPHIREDYIKKLIKNPSYQLDTFFELTGKSIRQSV